MLAVRVRARERGERVRGQTRVLASGRLSCPGRRQTAPGDRNEGANEKQVDAPWTSRRSARVRRNLRGDWRASVFHPALLGKLVALVERLQAGAPRAAR